MRIQIHHQTPEVHKIERLVREIRNGSVMLYPTDTGFSLACDLSNKAAIDKIRALRDLPAKKHLSFICSSLSNISEYAKVSNTAYRFIKSVIPGPYTFILPATREVPNYAQDPKRKTVGIRVPDNIIAMSIIEALGNPILSISAKPGDEYLEAEEIIEEFENRVDVVVESTFYDFTGESTVIDMTTDEFTILRKGAGLEKLGTLEGK